MYLMKEKPSAWPSQNSAPGHSPAMICRPDVWRSMKELRFRVRWACCRNSLPCICSHSMRLTRIWQSWLRADIVRRCIRSAICETPAMQTSAQVMAVEWMKGRPLFVALPDGCILRLAAPGAVYRYSHRWLARAFHRASRWYACSFCSALKAGKSGTWRGSGLRAQRAPYTQVGGASTSGANRGWRQ